MPLHEKTSGTAIMEKMMERAIQKEAIINTSVDNVWEVWTTEAGVLTFFAPQANVELAIGGKYEMLFAPEMPPGSQGGEGLKILSYLPGKMLSFDWNAPPRFPNVRRKRTWVVLQFAEVESGRTRVELTHLGWKDGEEWDKVFEYFTSAWDTVLGRLAYRFSNGPVDWENPYRP